MTDELQAEASAPIENENLDTAINTEPPSQESESAPDTGENQEQKIVFDEGQQKVVDDLMAKKTFKVREAEREGERKLQELQKQFDEVKAKIPQDVRPEIPPVPDPYDMSEDEFKAQMAARDEVVRKVVEFDTSQSAVKSQQEADTQAQLQEQKKVMDKTVSDYVDRANKLGVDTQKLAAAETKVLEFGIDQRLGNYILSQDLGPLIPGYLAENLAELDALNRMSTESAAVYIATDILPKIKAAQTVTKPTAPDPVETLSGGGSSQTKGLKGVTYS